MTAFVNHIVPTLLVKTLTPKLADQRASNKGHVRLDKQYEEAVYQKLCGEED